MEDGPTPHPLSLMGQTLQRHTFTVTTLGQEYIRGSRVRMWWWTISRARGSLRVSGGKSRCKALSSFHPKKGSEPAHSAKNDAVTLQHPAFGPGED